MSPLSPALKTPPLPLPSVVSTPFVRIWVEDNGIGVPQDSRERIFGMFQRAANGYEGTGVGLAIVRKLVERMGGRVGVESEEDHGSRFWLELHRAPAWFK